MSDSEKILNDVSEIEETGYIEAYVRFNDDFDRDYCFLFKASDTFRDVLKVFKTLPMSLRPNVFYNLIPVAFNVSTSPGYLTDSGTVLFDYQVTKEQFLKKVDLDDKISDKIWPGQLIVPVWQYDYFSFYSFITFLIVWLYTDLPDSISPTPGICFTNQISKIASKIAGHFHYDHISQLLVADLYDPVPIMQQVLFFGFHVIKVLAILAYVNTGAFNPMKVIKFLGEKAKTGITKEELLEIGWTGSKRAPPDEYRAFYKKAKIEEAGGVLYAHQHGILENLKHIGVFLGKGEGYNTPLDEKSTLKDLLDETKPKFTLNYQYFAALGQLLIDYTEQDGVDVEKEVKRYRTFGMLNPGPVITKIVEKRKKYGDTSLLDLL